MFYFLLITGAVLISFGLYLRKAVMPSSLFPAAGEMPEPQMRREDQDMQDNPLLLDLKDRMEVLEKTLFESLMTWQMEKKELEARLEAESSGDGKKEVPLSMEAIEIAVPEVKAPKRKPMPDNIKAIVDYENQGLSVQEIANVTRMNKGEVLLLRSLSKHYTK